jgi:SAM-dependent methyltransferase
MAPLLRLAGASSAVSYASAASARGASNSSSEIAKVLLDPKYPEVFPFGEKEMQRYDESSDFMFYAQPRFVKHIDDDAIGALTKYYKEVFPAVPKDGDEKVALLDVCSSWISHYPSGYEASANLRVSGLGMNEDELKKNPILSDYAVRDLNEDPTLPYEDNTFDVVTNAVSVDYLTKPLEMMKEVNRVLKPGGARRDELLQPVFPDQGGLGVDRHRETWTTSGSWARTSTSRGGSRGWRRRTSRRNRGKPIPCTSCSRAKRRRRRDPSMNERRTSFFFTPLLRRPPVTSHVPS